MHQKSFEKINKSIVFSWKQKDFDALLKSCEFDDEVKITLKYLTDKNAKILEAGCGLGRVVKYLYDRGYKNIHGIELDRESVLFLNQNFSELNVVQGDILKLPYKKESFDVVLSYGVIEHFSDGPLAPMKAMYDVLKPGGLAIVTVPSFNILRRISYNLSLLDIRKWDFIRRAFGKKKLYRNKKIFSYYIDPQYGSFFEYRFTPKQFEFICKTSDFEIVESLPIAHIDGLFNSFCRPLVKFKNWEFEVSFWGKVLNKVFGMIPFLHNHMHACVLRKPKKNNRPLLKP